MVDDNELVKLLLNFPNKPWEWRWISENPNITMDTIQKYPDKPWDWASLVTSIITNSLYLLIILNKYKIFAFYLKKINYYLIIMTIDGKEKQFLTIQEASLFSGLSKQTLRKMVDLSQLDSYKTPTNQRRINKQSIQKLCHNDIYDESKQICQKQNFIYTRVSTKKQMDDLSRQVSFLQRPEYSDYTIIQDIGSGINFKRKGLQTILDCCIRRSIGEVIVAHRDRLCRFAFELIESIIQKSGGTLKVLNNDNNISKEDELSQDLLSIIHIFNCRQMGKRSYIRKNKPGQNVQNSNNEIISN